MYKKIIVIGCSGSGKTTFSTKLAHILDYPLYYLDSIYWKEDCTHISRNELISETKEIFKEDKWIIDGNFRNTLELRIRACDLIYFFDIPRERCIEGVYSRVGKVRSEMPCNLPVDDELISFINNFNSDVKPLIYKLFAKYPDKKVVTFHSRDEADKYLNQL